MAQFVDNADINALNKEVIALKVALKIIEKTVAEAYLTHDDLKRIINSVYEVLND